jgi:thioredoxin-related protein
VLLDVGANWCSWCLGLHDLFTRNEKVSAILKQSYQVVYVDAGHGEKNRDILVFYGLNVKNYPHLAVLDTDGNLITQQDAGIFESKGTHLPEKVAAFLEKWKVPTPAK